MPKIKISVIIPVFNEEKNIIDCLQSLEKQLISNFEVILVDDGSFDNTINIINQYKSKNYKLNILLQKHKGPALARNLGVLSAIGEILVFIDADMTFDKKFLQNLTRNIIDGCSKGTTSIDEYVSNWNNVWARCWNINEGINDNKRHKKNINNQKNKVFRAILKLEFERVGGFSKGGYTDDYSLAAKLGYEADVVQNAIFYHKNPDNLKEVFLQSKWAAKRTYKLGFWGELIAIIRANVIFSLLVGIYKAVKYKEVNYVFFKLIFDFALIIGIYEYKIFGSYTK